jgi:hypothetical protein
MSLVLFRLDGLQFFLEQSHAFVTIEKNARRAKPAILKRPIGSGQKDGGLTLTDRAWCRAKLPQSRCEDHFIYMFGWISVALWINEFIQPTALFLFFGHVPAPLEMNL